MKTFVAITFLVLSYLSQAQSQKADSTLRLIKVTVRSESKNGKVKSSDKTYVFDLHQSYVLEPTKDDEWLSEAIDHKSCKYLKDWQDKGNVFEIKAEKFNRRKTEITYSIPVNQNGIFTITENNKTISSVGADVKMIYEPAYISSIRDTITTFSQTKTNSVSTQENDMWYINLVPLKSISNRKTKEFKEHYIFQVSHDFIYVVNKNQNIKYTMEMTKIINFRDYLEVTAKQFDENKKEVTFKIPLKNGLVFSNSTSTFSDYIVEVYTKKDVRK